MVIKELGIGNIDNWYDFFDNRAFVDHEEWNTCYCTAFYYPRPEEYAGASNRKRDYARWLIENGRMKGYLAFEDGRAVGWVNANDKRLFPRLADICAQDEKVLSIVCFLVEKEHRGKGIAQELLDKVIEGAKGKGYSIIEAYPKKKAKSEYGAWNGPYEMYIKNGFKDCRIGTANVVRREIG